MVSTNLVSKLQNFDAEIFWGFIGSAVYAFRLLDFEKKEGFIN